MPPEADAPPLAGAVVLFPPVELLHAATKPQISRYDPDGGFFMFAND
jgi:hypothetical protein